MKTFLVCVLVAGVSLAQGKPVASRDAGVVLPSKPMMAADAGVPEPMRGPAAPSGAEVEKLRKDVVELRARLTDLELKAAKTDTLANDLEKLSRKFDTLKADVDAAEERRGGAERELERRKVQTAQATTTVTAVLQQLSSGNTSNVDAWLRGAEQQYTGNAQKLVSLAREALSRGDLGSARQYLNLALLEGPSTAP